MKYLTRPQIASVLAEFIGTGILVMVAIILTQTTGVSYFVGTSVAAALGVIYVLFGGISGAYVNPAVTFGMWTARKIGTIRAAVYIAAELIAGLASLELYQYLTNHHIQSRHVSFSTPMWLAELVGTAVLAFTLASVASRKLDTLTSALTYAFSFFVGILIASTASAALLNPATALGLRNFNSIYVLGPLVGGLIGVNLYVYVFGSSAKK